MKIPQIVEVGLALLIAICLSSCIKTPPVVGNAGNGHGDTTVISPPTDSSGHSQKCDPLHTCPPGYACENGHCKSLPGECNCIRPIPPGCAALCGPVASFGKDGDSGGW